MFGPVSDSDIEFLKKSGCQNWDRIGNGFVSAISTEEEAKNLKKVVHEKLWIHATTREEEGFPGKWRVCVPIEDLKPYINLASLEILAPSREEERAPRRVFHSLSEIKKLTEEKKEEPVEIKNCSGEQAEEALRFEPIGSYVLRTSKSRPGAIAVTIKRTYGFMDALFIKISDNPLKYRDANDDSAVYSLSEIKNFLENEKKKYL
jgi:SH2 domain